MWPLGGCSNFCCSPTPRQDSHTCLGGVASQDDAAVGVGAEGKGSKAAWPVFGLDWGDSLYDIVILRGVRDAGLVDLADGYSGAVGKVACCPSSVGVALG